MNVKEISHNTWKVYDIGTIKYICILGLYINCKAQYLVKIKSFNAKEISLKEFNSEAAARSFVERFVSLLDEQEVL